MPLPHATLLSALRAGGTLALILLAAAITTPAVAAPAPVTAEVSLRPDAGSAAWQSERWAWPRAPRPRVLRAFEAPATPYGAGHRGVDLAGSAGQPVLAAGDGAVSYVGVLAGRGVVTVRHGDLRTTYEPVRAAASVGARVRAGATIGFLDRRGAHCQPTCLHWGLLRGREYLDPLVLLGGGPVRLLPLWGATGDRKTLRGPELPAPGPAATPAREPPAATEGDAAEGGTDSLPARARAATLAAGVGILGAAALSALLRRRVQCDAGLP